MNILYSVEDSEWFWACAASIMPYDHMLAATTVPPQRIMDREQPEMDDSQSKSRRETTVSGGGASDPVVHLLAKNIAPITSMVADILYNAKAKQRREHLHPAFIPSDSHDTDNKGSL